MEYITAQVEIQLPLSEDGYLFDMGSLYDLFLTLVDQRKARGKRFELALVLVLIVLAKLAGEDRPTGMAEWARHREGILIPVLKVAREHLPSHNTYRRVMRDSVEVSELQQAINKFFQGLPGVGQSVLIALDGKTLRGSLPTGHTRGVHLLAAYLPYEGIVLFQVAVGRQENEISAAPQLLKALDLRGKIVTGDALRLETVAHASHRHDLGEADRGDDLARKRHRHAGRYRRPGESAQKRLPDHQKRRERAHLLG